MKKILILNRDEGSSTAFGKMLEQEGFLQFIANTPETALVQLRHLQPQLLIIDLPLDGISGLEICSQLQLARFKTPTIILGDNPDEMEKVILLEMGVDDYLVKPFSSRELIARIRAILRRTASKVSGPLRFGDVEIDQDRRVVAYHGSEVKLTPCEYNLLLFFLQNADRPLTRDAILSAVWGYHDYPNTRTVDTHVCKLRNKFESDPASPRHFMTVHGIGYRFLT
ncbi:MAG: response regulator transcription factor [Acidobacteriaceae bacterium]|nr:response regulator transcription factor [Acidobacteriaceae bacterium]MBV8571770.1 response regulator transcription factor [Acidobacteriaceae bacterium]